MAWHELVVIQPVGRSDTHAAHGELCLDLCNNKQVVVVVVLARVHLGLGEQGVHTYTYHMGSTWDKIPLICKTQVSASSIHYTYTL